MTPSGVALRLMVALCLGLGGLGLGAWGMGASAQASEPTADEAPIKAISGYAFSAPETQAMQDDDYSNPAFVWIEQANESWFHEEGQAGHACATCHEEPARSMKGVAARYPRYDPATDRPITLEQMINRCRTTVMQAEPWGWESDRMLGMSAFIRMQSRGMPINLTIDDKLKPFLEEGRRIYYQHQGMYDFACSDCHEDNAGKYLRAELLSQGQSNGFPTYRLKWSKLGSLHRRVQECSENTRAEPYAADSEDYVNLELFLTWRAQGLPIEAPAVRK